MPREHHEYILEGAIAENSSVATLTGIEKSFERHYMSVVFFDSELMNNQVAVNTMVGTVQVQASDNGFQFGEVSEGDIVLGNDSYPRPTVQGSLASVRMDFSGITTPNSASHYRIYLNSHRG